MMCLVSAQGARAIVGVSTYTRVCVRLPSEAHLVQGQATQVRKQREAADPQTDAAAPSRQIQHYSTATTTET